MISCSRAGGLPANLQGIWCGQFDSEWDSKFTLNINLEMNYWAVDAANLSECGQPLYAFIRRLEQNGRVTAREMYGMEGACAHHNSDVWADTAPQDIVTGSTYWAFGLAWLSLHLYEHYLFTDSLEFLRDYYDVLKSAARFCLDWLSADESGRLCTVPSTSPENVYVTRQGAFSFGKSCAMDFEIMNELFRAVIHSCKILDTDLEFAGQLQEALEKFPEPAIGGRGQLLEWNEEFDELDPGHRHFSHLFSLFPGKAFSPDLNAPYADAARASLEYRLAHGSAQTGWSRAWAVNLFARLKDPQAAYTHLVKLIQLSTINNLFNSHPPFQIDGNFGALSGICEMLLQSHGPILDLLPAFDVDRIQSGSIKGLRARGNITVNIEISNGNLAAAEFLSGRDQAVQVRYRQMICPADLKGGQWLRIHFEQGRPAPIYGTSE